MRHNEYQHSPLEAALSKFFSLLGEFFVSVMSFSATFSLIEKQRPARFICFKTRKHMVFVRVLKNSTSAMKPFLTSVSLQHEPKASDVITLVKKTFFRTSIVRNFISRGVKMRISAREACGKPHLRTRSGIKVFMRLSQRKGGIRDVSGSEEVRECKVVE